jgi:hypothetical protein
MILGNQFVHEVQEWSGFRPFNDPGLQFEPPWRGDWNARVYDDELRVGTQYRCAVSSRGMAAGRYRIALRCPEQARPTWRILGDVLTEDHGVYRILFGNVWAELTVNTSVAVRDLGFAMTPVDGDVDVDQASPWHPDFLRAAEPFKAWRSMNFCGAGSRVATFRSADQFGGFARRSPMNNDDSEIGRWNAETGTNPRFWFPPGIKEHWVNCPLFIALDPAQRAAWLLECARWAPADCRVRVAVDNEMENHDFTISRFAHQYGRHLHADPNVGRTLVILLAAQQMKQAIDQLRLGPRFVPIFETMPRNFWPFSQFGGSYVSDWARDMLRDVGRFATAPYVGRSITSLSQLRASITEEVDAMRRWRDLVAPLVTEERIDVYEAGLHFPKQSPESWRVDPLTLDLVPVYLDEMNDVYHAKSVFMWYGLCEADQWGLLRKLSDVGSDPLYRVVADWARRHPPVAA